MKKTIKIVAILLVIAVIAGGIYYFIKLAKASRSVALQCGNMNINVSGKFMSLKAPETIAQLDKNGCVVAEGKCACVKLDNDSGEGLVFGVTENKTEEGVVPEKAEDQKLFLQQLGALIKSQKATTTAITEDMMTIGDFPTYAITSNTVNDLGVFTSKDVFFIRNKILYNITFQSKSAYMDEYWPAIIESLKTISFSN